MKRCTETLPICGRCRLHEGHDGQHQYMSSRDYRRARAAAGEGKTLELHGLSIVNQPGGESLFGDGGGFVPTALSELSALREKVAAVDEWAGPDGCAALAVLIGAVAHGATLTIEPRPLLCSGGGYLAKLESGTGARYVETSSSDLGLALAELAQRWSKP